MLQNEDLTWQAPWNYIADLHYIKCMLDWTGLIIVPSKAHRYVIIKVFSFFFAVFNLCYFDIHVIQSISVPWALILEDIFEDKWP
jgi:hypothetical protein